QEQIHQPGGDGEGRAVLERDGGDVAVRPRGQGDEVHRSRAGGADGGEIAQPGGAGACERVDLAVHGDADEGHEHDDHEEGGGSASPPEVEVAGAGNEVREDDSEDGTGLHCAAKTSFPMAAKWGWSRSKVTSRSSGTRRVRAVTVMKFVSPPQRG